MSLDCEYPERSIPFGRYCLNRPFALSFDPNCQGLWGQTLMSVASVKQWTYAEGRAGVLKFEGAADVGTDTDSYSPTI